MNYLVASLLAVVGAFCLGFSMGVVQEKNTKASGGAMFMTFVFCLLALLVAVLPGRIFIDWRW